MALHLLTCSTFLLSFALAEEPVPFVFWSMDKIDRTKIIPENNTDSKFQGDFRGLSSDPSDIFVAGVVENALLVKKSSFDLAESITRSDCIRTPDVCTSGGLSFAFWLNIQKWNSDLFQVFFRTTTATKTTPGVYFGKGDDDNLLAYFREDSGKYYETTFPQAYFWNTWSHLSIVWTKNNDLSVYINGSLIPTTTATAKAEARSASLTDLVIGSSVAPDFMLDEFKVFYHNLSALEAMDVFMGDIGKGNVHTTVAETKALTKSSMETSTMSTSSIIASGSIIATTISGSQPLGTQTELFAIIIPLIAVICAALCIFLVCCHRYRRNKQKEKEFRMTYHQVSVSVENSENVYSSNHGTDVETDNENDRMKPLISSP